MASLPADFATALAPLADRLRPVASRVLYRLEVESTNDVAAEIARSGAPDGTVVLADSQRRGRGRRGRSWFSPRGAGLYVSILFRIDPAQPIAPPANALLTLMAGAALAESIGRATGLRILVKWPNDLIIERGGTRATRSRRKVGGILAEASVVGGRVDHVVLGFGVNLRAVSYPADVAPAATSLEAELCHPVDRGLILAESLVALAEGRRALLEGRHAEVLERWKALSPSSVGEIVRWEDETGWHEGTTAGLADDGALLVRSPDEVHRVVSGELIWV